MTNQEAVAALPIVERVARMKHKTMPQRDWDTLSEVQDAIEELVEALKVLRSDLEYGMEPSQIRGLDLHVSAALGRIDALLAKLEAGDTQP
jgi:hypothetical protein